LTLNIENFMETHLYTCQFCQIKYKPAKRKIQKFCSATCKSKDWHHKNKKAVIPPMKKVPESLGATQDHKTENKQMSLPGIGDAATGTFIVQQLTRLFTKFENKAATKKDIEEIKNLINTRYFKIHNHPPDRMGRKPFFDMGTGEIKYYNDVQHRYELPLIDLSR